MSLKTRIYNPTDSLEALMNSELASIYLPDEKVARNHLIEAFERKEMYLAC